MGNLFGTDGIRGIVGENLTVELAFHTGQAIAAVLKEEKGRAPLITIGKDTRISSDMLESALICGICSVGGDVMPFGVLPTPAVAYLTVLKGADAGIVISASHNPFEHNGIKVFNEKGYKLPDATEAKIEEKILSGETIPVATRGEIRLDPQVIHTVAYVSDPTVLQRLVAEGTGVSILSALAVQETVAAGQLLQFELDETPVRRSIYMARRRKSSMSSPARTFAELVRKQAKASV